MSHTYRLSRVAVLTALSALLAALPAFAQQPEPSPAPSEPTKVEFTTAVDAYYGYNVNGVDPELHVFDIENDTLALSLAELTMGKDTNMTSRVGFRVDLNFGSTVDVVTSAERWLSDQDGLKHVLQAYGSVQIAESFSLDGGKFVTPIGSEVIQSWGNWNYTRSILFGYAIPFYHVGLRANWEASETVSLAGFLVNGWNNGSTMNGPPTFALGATITPSDRVTWVANVMTGPEESVNALADPSDELLTVFDTTLTFDVNDRLSLMGNAVYGTWSALGQDVTWSGFDLYARVRATNKLWLAGRYEWVNDEDGFMTIGQKAQSITLTTDFLVRKALRVRFEYRTDFTPDPHFTSNDGILETSQTTLTVGLVYGFDGAI